MTGKGWGSNLEQLSAEYVPFNIKYHHLGFRSPRNPWITEEIFNKQIVNNIPYKHITCKFDFSRFQVLLYTAF